MEEQKWQKVWDQYYTPEEQAKWKEAKMAVPEEERLASEKAWPELIARANALVGTNPASAEAQEVAKDWQALSASFMKSVDPALAKSVGRMYDNMDDWPEGGPEKPFSQEVWAFVQEAIKIAGD